MRDILFKGRLLATGEWTEGNLYVNPDGNIAIITQDGRYGQVDPETVGQYTGMIDKNDVKTFDGDIILLHDKTLFVIEYATPEFNLRHLNNSMRMSANAGSIRLFGEVVGNIHDNPELMDGKQ